MHNNKVSTYQQAQPWVPLEAAIGHLQEGSWKHSLIRLRLAVDGTWHAGFHQGMEESARDWEAPLDQVMKNVDCTQCFKIRSLHSLSLGYSSNWHTIEIRYKHKEEMPEAPRSAKKFLKRFNKYEELAERAYAERSSTSNQEVLRGISKETQWRSAWLINSLEKRPKLKEDLRQLLLQLSSPLENSERYLVDWRGYGAMGYVGLLKALWGEERDLKGLNASIPSSVLLAFLGEEIRSKLTLEIFEYKEEDSDAVLEIATTLFGDFKTQNRRGAYGGIAFGLEGYSAEMQTFLETARALESGYGSINAPC